VTKKRYDYKSKQNLGVNIDSNQTTENNYKKNPIINFYLCNAS